ANQGLPRPCQVDSEVVALKSGSGVGSGVTKQASRVASGEGGGSGTHANNNPRGRLRRSSLAMLAPDESGARAQ
ncbi:MAG TPA: hypothetical protein VGK32_02645, partial [Vicinamibacterales bacterium]